MPTPLSRRDFLKLSGLALPGLAFKPLPPEDAQALSAPPIGLGRTVRSINWYDRPSFAAKRRGVLPADAVLNIFEEVSREARTSHNATWYRVDDYGWVHSARVQPVRNELNTPVLDVPEGGFLVKVTVPFTDALRQVGGEERAYPFYYSTTHWVDQALLDADGVVWYRVRDDRYRTAYFVRGEHLRPVAGEELTPLSPGVTDKRVEIDLAQQTLVAYESGRAVLTAKVATGHEGWDTPTGEFRIQRKRPSRHMAAGDLAAGEGFDLPGVPWVGYFHWSGVAFHGTYWHNDYGTPLSAGCVNMTPQDARWLYRWTLPAVPPGTELVDGDGTEVIVF